MLSLVAGSGDVTVSVNTSHLALLLCCLSVQGQDWWQVTDAIHHLTFAPPTTLLQLSNQPVLICYNRGPSGPYYSNPCDVIPKQRCFLWSEGMTIHHLTRRRDVLALPPTYLLLLSPLWESRQHKDKASQWLFTGALHQHSACSQSCRSYKQWTVFVGL